MSPDLAPWSIMQAPLRQLLPYRDAPITIDELYPGPLRTRTDRPWLGLCMVASIDGSTVVDGVSAGLSSENDSAALHQLRSLAQVILVGAGTVRGEGYGPPKKDGQRIGVVTRSGSVDASSELFRSGAGFVITTERAELDDEIERHVEVIRSGTDVVDLRAALGRVDEIYPGVEFVQAEGGATLNAALSDVDLFDELNLTTSPATVGGGGPRLFNGGTDQTNRFELAQMAVDDDSFVFSRWLRRAQTSP